MFDLSKIEKVHFIGIGGIYVSALAMLMQKFNRDVSGCDTQDSDILVKLINEGIAVEIGHSEKHIIDGLDLVVYSAAVPSSHPELEMARNLGIKTMTAYEFLGEFSRDLLAITVSGTKGKTTTTGLIALILMEGQLDPTVIVGGNFKELPYGNLRVGESEYLVAEACEFQAQLLNLHPNITVLTNIEEDHLDYYRDLNHIIDTFRQFTAKLPTDGYLIINNDEVNCQLLGCSTVGNLITYGIDNESDIMAKDIKVADGRQTFDLYVDGRKVEEISLQIPGKFNIYNALGAIAAATHVGVKFSDMATVLNKFQGSWRRFEKLGECRGALVISDYAHTPASVSNLIKATKEFYPERRVVSIFQPHLHSRTKKLFNEFTRAFIKSDLTIISDIYFVEGRVAEEDKDVDSADLVAATSKVNSSPVLYGGDLGATKKMVLENIKSGDVVLIIGAGDIYKMGEELIKQ